MTHGRRGWQILNAWSTSGVATCIHVRPTAGPKNSQICFDMGVCPPQVFGVGLVFLSHGHLDHCSAIFTHARMHHRQKGHAARYFMPNCMVENILKAKTAFESLGGEEPIQMETHGMNPGDQFDIGGGSFVTAFQTTHRVDSLGYIVRDRVQNLKPEYQGLPGEEIGRLRKAGTAVCDVHESLEVAYTGDTEFDALLQVEDLWRTRLLIMEMTYLDGPTESATKWSHVHLNSVAANIACFSEVEKVVFMHFSAKYRREEVLHYLRQGLPVEMHSKVGAALRDFGSGKAVTMLDEDDSSRSESVERKGRRRSPARLPTPPAKAVDECTMKAPFEKASVPYT